MECQQCVICEHSFQVKELKLLSCGHFTCELDYTNLLSLKVPRCPGRDCDRKVEEKPIVKGDPQPFEITFEVPEVKESKIVDLAKLLKAEIDNEKAEQRKYEQQASEHLEYLQRLKGLAEKGYDVSHFDLTPPNPPTREYFVVSLEGKYDVWNHRPGA